MSQVVTLYKDKEKTDALYPRTKVSAISDENNTSLQELLNRYEIIDNLTSYETDKALSANQGRELNDSFKNYYDKTQVDSLLDNIDITGMVKQEEGGTQEEVVTPINADTLGGKLTANNVVFYEEEIVDEVGQVVLRNADLLENHPASYYLNPLIAYPIGSVYLSVNDTNPSTILGGGTWELIGSKLAVRENVVGNGYTLPLTDGNNIGGLCVAFSGSYVTTGLSGLYGQLVNTNKSGVASLPLDKGLGIPTKAQLDAHLEYSGLIVDTETIYSWKRVA